MYNKYLLPLLDRRMLFMAITLNSNPALKKFWSTVKGEAFVHMVMLYTITEKVKRLLFEHENSLEKMITISKKILKDSNW